MTSMSQYRDNQPRYSGRSPSPAFYATQGDYEAYGDSDDELNYPVDNIDYIYDAHDHRHRRSVSPRPRSAAGVSSSMRQTPSPLRWAMQDLMDSLDTMSPQLPSTTSPRDSFADINFMDGQSHGYIGYPGDRWESTEPVHAGPPRLRDSDEIVPPYMYPADIRPPPLLNYVDKMECKFNRVQNCHHSPWREGDHFYQHYEGQRSPSERSPSRVSNPSDRRPRSSHSTNKALPTSPSYHPPIPPPHVHRHRETESITSQSTKNSAFSSNSSDYSTAASSVSTGSAGSAGAFARKKHQQQRQEQEINGRRTALSVVLPKSNSSAASALKRRKSYGSSLKKTIGKLLSTSPTKPPPGTVTDHGDKIIEWQNVRRDVNRANTPSEQERTEHRERLEMSEGIELVRPIELLERIIEGDESANGSPILPDETFDITSNS